jgi:hypothetical protein
MDVLNMQKLALILTLISIAGCSLNPGRQEVSQPSFKAVYFFQKESQLSLEDLKAHPEVVTVQTFDEFKKYAHQKLALWIDKRATPFDSEQEKWINEAPQAYYPIVLVGTSDTLYSFRDLLRLCCFLGPAGIYHGFDAPGFSILQREPPADPTTAPMDTPFIHGYNQKPTVQSIHEITNALLEGKLNPTPIVPLIPAATATKVP